jgi:hypothetical protein
LRHVFEIINQLKKLIFIVPGLFYRNLASDEIIQRLLGKYRRKNLVAAFYNFVFRFHKLFSSYVLKNEYQLFKNDKKNSEGASELNFLEKV